MNDSLDNDIVVYVAQQCNCDEQAATILLAVLFPWIFAKNRTDKLFFAEIKPWSGEGNKASWDIVKVSQESQAFTYRNASTI